MSKLSHYGLFLAVLWLLFSGSPVYSAFITSDNSVSNLGSNKIFSLTGSGNTAYVCQKDFNFKSVIPIKKITIQGLDKIGSPIDLKLYLTNNINLGTIYASSSPISYLDISYPSYTDFTLINSYTPVSTSTAYTICLVGSANVSHYWKIYYSTSNETTGNISWPLYGGGSNEDTGKDIGFYAYNSDNIIFFNYPLNNTTSTDFTAWKIGYSTNLTSTLLSSGVLYSTSSNFINYFSDYSPIVSLTSLDELILKQNDLSVGVWYAKAVIIETSFISTTTPPYLPTATTTIITSSTPISFTIYNGEKINNIPIFTPVSPGNATSSIWSLSCDPAQGIIANSFCNMLVFTIIPSANSLNSLTGIKDLVILKPPLGYFSQINNFLSIGFTTSSSAIDLTALTPLTLTGGLFWYIKAGLSWLLWALFGFWVFKKFRHFQL